MKYDVRPMSTETFISAPAGFAIAGGGSACADAYGNFVGGGSSDVAGDEWGLGVAGA